jgi:hypothetical protein
LFTAVMLALCGALLPTGVGMAADTTLQPDKLIILSTTDVKGKTSPCG